MKFYNLLLLSIILIFTNLNYSAAPVLKLTPEEIKDRIAILEEMKKLQIDTVKALEVSNIVEVSKVMFKMFKLIVVQDPLKIKKYKLIGKDNAISVNMPNDFVETFIYEFYKLAGQEEYPNFKKLDYHIECNDLTKDGFEGFKRVLISIPTIKRKENFVETRRHRFDDMFVSVAKSKPEEQEEKKRKEEGASLVEDFKVVDLFDAIKDGDFDKARRLILIGRDLNLLNYMNARSPLTHAVIYHNKKVFDFILDADLGFDLEMALYHCVGPCLSDKEEIRKYMLDKLLLKKPNVNVIVSTQGYAPLHAAAANGQVWAIQRLIAAGANLDLQTLYEKKTARELAHKAGHKYAVLHLDLLNNFIR